MNDIKVAFRVDSSINIGAGHLMRCLTLAEQLRKYKKAQIIFICRELEGNINCIIKKKGFSLIVLPKRASAKNLTEYEQWLTVTQKDDAEEVIDTLKFCQVDWLIVDNYAIAEEWQNIVRPFVKRIMVIDDLANRKHNCDILLDQNYYLDMNTRYQGLVPVDCKQLLGPEYILLREEFYAAKEKIHKRNGKIKNILVFFGGSDPSNETGKALDALIESELIDVKVNVVVGEGNPNKEKIKLVCLEKKYKYFCQVDNMAQLMAEADLSIGAGGTTTWERCFLELPSIVIALAENQIKLCEDAARMGFILFLGVKEHVTVEVIKKALLDVLRKPFKQKVEINPCKFPIKKFL